MKIDRYHYFNPPPAPPPDLTFWQRWHKRLKALAWYLLGLVLCGWIAVSNWGEGWREIYYIDWFDGWQKAQGTILRSRLRYQQEGKYGFRYDVVVEYDYWVGSRLYLGERIRFGMVPKMGVGNITPDNRAERLYPPGSKMPVFYDPAHPEVAVLDPIGLAGGNDHHTPMGFALIGCVLCLWGGARTLWPRWQA